MNKVFLGVLREIGIILLILVVLAAAIIIAFKDQLPYEDKIPTGEQYTQINRKQYSVSTNDRISEINAVTVTHESNQGQILSAEEDIRIQTGKYTPFGTIDGTNDLPTEKVGVSVSTPQASGDEILDYPDDDKEKDIIKSIERDQNQDSASLLDKRMNNAD